MQVSEFVSVSIEVWNYNTLIVRWDKSRGKLELQRKIFEFRGFTLNKSKT